VRRKKSYVVTGDKEWSVTREGRNGMTERTKDLSELLKSQKGK
jgi:hypothetical protein